MNLFTKQKQTHRHRKKLMIIKGESGGGINQEFGINIYILLYIKQINNKDLLYSTGDYTQYFFFLILFIYLFIYGCVGSSFLCEGFLQLRQAGAILHRGARASHYRGLSCCGAQAPDAQAQQLWLTGLVAPWHVGSSQTRVRTRVPCIGRQILNHCATREAQECLLKEKFLEMLCGCCWSPGEMLDLFDNSHLGNFSPSCPYCFSSFLVS